MKTPLAFRNVDVRLFIAYMAHAVHGFQETQPDDTIGRWLNGNNIHEGETYHRYTQMWEKIGSFYIEQGLNAMSDKEISDLYKGASRVGFEYRGTQVEPMKVLKAQQTWHQRNWTRYEQRRNSRRAKAWQVAPWAASIGFACVTGVFINPEGGA